MICVCDDPDFERTIPIPEVAITPGRRCWDSAEHAHRCWRPAGHTGRHWDGEHVDGRTVLVTAVWP